MAFVSEDKENQDYEYQDPDINPKTGKKWFEACFVKDKRERRDLKKYLVLKTTDR